MGAVVLDRTAMGRVGLAPVHERGARADTALSSRRAVACVAFFPPEFVRSLSRLSL